MSTRPHVSVVVPSYGRPLDLGRCLAALGAQRSALAEVIVVTREGDDETADAARAASAAHGLTLTIATVHTPGHLPPLQAGIAAARSEVVAFIDDDCEPWAGWAEQLAGHYLDSTVGGVGGLVVQPGVSDRLTAERIGKFGVVPRLARTFSARIPSRWGARNVDVIAGGNMSYRADLLREYVWDARMNRGAATDYEVHLAAFVRGRGYRIVYDPDAIVTHYIAPRVDLGRNRSASEIFDYSHNLVYVAGRSFGPIRATLAIADALFVGNRFSYGFATAAYDLMRQGRPSFRNQIAPSFAGKLAGLASLIAYGRDGVEPLP
jgi:glycosyltransferase involved in cell wall biosynthesis